MGEVIEIGDADFQEVVERSREPVLVDFTAEGCAPCRAMARALEALASDYAGRLKVAMLDVGRNQVTAERFGVRAMPTLLLFRDGRVVRQMVGSLSRAKLEEAIRAVS